jgi:ABC-type bacteriocin/lantibiotic exporter with double-glycine peptidase domain
MRGLAQHARSGAVTLEDVSLTIDPGELVAIIGGSGSGKSTLLDTMCGLRPPAAGRRSGDPYFRKYRLCPPG